MEDLRAAVIGLGFVGRAHVEALRRLGVPVRGVLGSAPDRTQDAAQSLRLGQAYNSIDELANDTSVDVVHICTPNHLHHDQANILLNTGKHVMCEKPLAMNTKESAALVQTARQQRRVSGVTYNLRYYPLCQEARAMVERGLIGEPRLVHGSFLQDWLFYPTDWNWRLEPHLGGELRAVSDIGTHWLDLMMWITGCKVTEVCADLATVIPIRHRPRGRVETFQQPSAGNFDEVKINTDDYDGLAGQRRAQGASVVRGGWFRGLAGLAFGRAEHAVDRPPQPAQSEDDEGSCAHEPGSTRLRGVSGGTHRRLSRHFRAIVQRFLRLHCGG